MARILVIGASGSLGKGVIAHLKFEHEITGTYSKNRFVEEGVEVRHADVMARESLESLGSEFDTVILIAGAMPASMAGYDPQQYVDTNITGTLNVLEFCRRSNINKLIYVMTFSDVSHKFFSGVPIKSDDTRGLTLVGDHAVYSISKVSACDLIQHYHEEYGLQTIIYRIPTVYCADRNFDYYVDGVKKTKAYVEMIKSIVSDRKVELWGEPGRCKDMPYIKDFARLIELGATHETAQGVFNAGTGNPVSLKELVEAMIAVFACDSFVEIIYRPDKPSQPNFTFDMSKTQEVFGFVPRWGLRDMLQDIRDTVGIEAFKK